MNTDERAELLKSLRNNKRQVEMAITHLNSFHVRAVRSGKKINELTLDNMFAKQILPLWVSLFEIELDIILYQNPFFDTLTTDKKFIKESEINKWLTIVELLFRRAYNINAKRPLDILTLGDTAYHRYEKLVDLIKNKLSLYVEMRNRIAHGQWSVAFGSYNRTKNQQLTQSVWTLSKKDLMVIKVYYKNFPSLIHQICLSKAAFENKYESHMNKINLVDNEIEQRFKWLLSRKYKSKPSLH